MHDAVLTCRIIILKYYNDLLLYAKETVSVQFRYIKMTQKCSLPNIFVILHPISELIESCRYRPVRHDSLEGEDNIKPT